MPDDALATTLVALARVMAAARDPWWIIGSAAVMLHGATTTVDDVDVLLSTRDADSVDARLGIGLVPGSGNDRFRSTRYGRWIAPPMPVEFMADLHVRDGVAWTPLAPKTRMAVPVGTTIVHVPDRVEMVAILTSFGRPKDLRRAALLRDRGSPE